MIFGRVQNIFMTLVTSNFYKSLAQSRLHDFLDDSLSSVSKFVTNYGESKTWDEWATYFEHKDFDLLTFREEGIFFLLCARMQESLFQEVSSSSFDWNNLSLEDQTFYLRYASEIELYLYENRKRSVYKRIGHAFIVLLFCNHFWINFFGIIEDYDYLCHEYIKIILKSSRECVGKNIVENKKDISDSKDLFWNVKAYDYLEKQGKLFDSQLSKLGQEFSNKYVIFEDGKIIDSDDDEMVLLDRIAKTDFYKDHPDAIFCDFVPKSSISVKVNA